jgi:tape measure domain-containing protein
LATLGDLIVRVGAEISGFTSAMKDVAGQLDEFGDKVEEKFESIGNVGSRMATVGAELTAGITLPIVALGTAALETAAQFEQSQVAFTLFMGSADLAKGMLDDLYKFAATTPFQIPGVLQGARTLMAMQFAAKDVVPVLRTLGDAASGLGLGQEGMERLIYHFGQIKAEGAIDGRVLRELGMAGINAGQMLADALGKSVPDIRKMIHDKAIDATTAINALLKGMNEIFGGGMQNQMTTLSGMWSNFKDQIILTLNAIGQSLAPMTKNFLDFGFAANMEIRSLAERFAQLPPPIQAATLALAGMAAAAGPVLATIGGIGLMLPGFMAVLGPLTTALGISTLAFFGWVGAIAAALAGLTALYVWTKEHTIAPPMAEFGRWGAGAMPSMVPTKASEDAKKQAKEIQDAMRTLRLSGEQGATQLSDPKEAWLEKHKVKVEEYTKAVEALRKGFESGAVPAKDMAAALERLDRATNEKMPNFLMEHEGKEGKTKPNRNYLDELQGELRHAETEIQRRRAELEHSFEMAKPGERSRDRIEDGSFGVEIGLAGQRRRALDALAKEELDTTLRIIDEKMKAYKSDEDGYQKLLAEKTKAQDKFQTTLQKDRFEEETAGKRANDNFMNAYEQYAERLVRAEEEKAKKIEAAAKHHAESMLQIADTVAQAERRRAELQAEIEDRAARYQLEIGGITSRQYILLKEKQYEDAYQAELRAIQKERDLLESYRASIGEDEFGRRTERLDSRKGDVEDKRKLRTQETGIDLGLDRYHKFFQPIEANFSGMLVSLVEGTKTFGQAWQNMVTGMLNSWITSLAQMAAKWVAHKLFELTFHVATNQAKVASDATAAAQSNSISLAQHFREMFRAAAQAAARTWAAVAAIPIVGPVLAPPAAAAAFIGVMALGAVSAERGAVLPDENTIAFLHPKEMVLPAHLSQGLQSMLSNGGNMMAQSANSIGFTPTGVPSSQTAQMLNAANDATDGSGDTHFHGGVHMTVHNSAKDPLTAEKLHRMFQQAVRMKNLQMA